MLVVRPVGAYAAHVWGPSMYKKFLFDPLNADNAVEEVHCSCFRLLAELGKSVHKESLYKEFDRYPLLVQWLVLAARWWNTVLGKRQGCLALKALKDDVSLMLKHKRCWSRQVFVAMSTIKVIDKSKWHPRKGELSKEDILKQIRFDIEQVRVSAERWFDRAWEACNSDPSMAREDGVFRST